MTNRVTERIVSTVSQRVSHAQAAAAINYHSYFPMWRLRFAVQAIEVPVGIRFNLAPSFIFALALLLAVMLTALSGCVVTETTVPSSAVPTLAERVPINAAWRMQAKVAATTPAGTETASVAWHRIDSARDTLVISGPLGLGSRTVVRTGGELGWLDNGRMTPLSELSLEEAHLHLIASLPIKDLALRLMGHSLDSTSDKEWQFSVASWQQLSGYTVPRKLRAQRAGVSIDMVILSLTLEPTP